MTVNKRERGVMNMMFRPLVYVAGRFQNEPRNARKIEECIKEVMKLDEDVIFFSPVLAFGFLYEIVLQSSHVLPMKMSVCYHLRVGQRSSLLSCVIPHFYYLMVLVFVHLVQRLASMLHQMSKDCFVGV